VESSSAATKYIKYCNCSYVALGGNGNANVSAEVQRHKSEIEICTKKKNESVKSMEWMHFSVSEF